MKSAFIAGLAIALSAQGATHILLRTTAGKVVDGPTAAKAIRLVADGKTQTIRLDDVLSLHNAAPASDFEVDRIASGIASLSTGKPDPIAIEELTSIGLPVLTPLLKAYKDTDQHEPRPLYRLFEKIIPSAADGFDRALSLVRLKSGAMLRGQLEDAAIDVNGNPVQLRDIRTLAVRQQTVRRVAAVHSLKHSTQIEYLDSGIVLSAASRVDSTAHGFARLSWDTDSWASDANGLTKPGAPAYKSHLVDGHPFGALVGRVGPGGEVYFLGRKASKTGLPAGRLMLAINDNRHWQNNIGSYTVELVVTGAYDVGDAQ